ncbi:conserved hypothetical protein [Talaromyces stipitatus ATCC 10500]|uniref:BZIP domain-containing protein n=1 Tax=Talaromyces stipitatus (strain ATCC 10500 / CBS 375.48 / QM 6759 / NRRL 1006) TaxID=441959 RepID=B8MAK2_TALSN|nr:uncharacterized protein TSTA_112590 [Talaromyces stipitatus ATCC 10500]EED17426.1 conserved hypothetical protein [Talaromyces stipitatus ATCC 10500]
MAGKSKAESLVVPELTEDAAERKRVLNVLAQRRYRQRRRERLRALESRVKYDGVVNEDSTINRSKASRTRRESREEEVSDQLEVQTDLGAADGAVRYTPVSSLPFNNEDDDQPAQFDMSFLSPFNSQSLMYPAIDINDTFTLSAFGTSPQMDMSTFESEHQLLDSLLDRSDDTTPSSYETGDISDELQTSESAIFTFPDDRLLEVPPLTLLNAALQVAQRLQIAELIWDLGAISPFYQGQGTSSSSSPSLSPPSLSMVTTDSSSAEVALSATLPTHLRPTSTQLLIPHHPLLDLLPWPSTRDKLIQIFNLPPNLRPKTAQSPMGLIQLVEDMEDTGGEGVKVLGSDPFEPCGWEIGQLMFEKWWWAFDTELVTRSNQARKKRGEKGLAMQGSQL